MCWLSPCSKDSCPSRKSVPWCKSACSRLALSPEQDAQQYALDPPAQQKLTEILLNVDGGRSNGLLSSDLHTLLVSSEWLLARSLAGLGERLPPGPGLTLPRTLPCRKRTGSRIAPRAFAIAPLLSRRRLQRWRLSGRIRRPIGKWRRSVLLLLFGRWGLAKPWSAL
jgi:hypothetical protein